MRPKSSKNGKRSAASLHIVPSQPLSEQAAHTLSSEVRGWQRNTGTTLTSGPTPFDTWVDSQVRSILGTMYSEKTKSEYLATHDVNTRRPKTEGQPAPSRFARALRAAWKAGGTILLGFGISGCANETPNIPERIQEFNGSLYRTYDPDYGVACYSRAYSGPYVCVQVREGLKR